MSSDIGIKGTYDGLHPADCYGNYDADYKECRVDCKISHVCKPVTARRKAGTPPVSKPAPPPPPSAPEPTPAPAPMDYLRKMLGGKERIKLNRKMSNQKMDVTDVLSASGKLFARVIVPKEGEVILVQSATGRQKHNIDSIEAAEKVLATL